MPYKNIVVGIAETDTSKLAGRKAFELAELCGARVHVVTSVTEGEVAVIEIGSDTFHIDELEAAEAAVREFVASLSPTVEWEVVRHHDKPAAAILAVAEEVEADLIVVGNVRMQGLKRVMGSVGNDIAHHAPCSVLIVKTV